MASADGRYLYYAVKTGSLWTRHPLPHWSIARRDVASGKEEVIVQTAGGAMRPALSHDGRLLAYASRNGRDTGLRLRDLDSGADRWIVPRIDHDLQEGGYYVDLVPRIGFTADDRAIVTSIDGGLKRIDLADGGVHDIPFVAPVRVAVGSPTRVAQREETGEVRVRVIQTPRLSRDGRNITFAALGRLYVQSTRPGSRPRAVRGVQGMAYQPEWSPDGRTLAYVTWSRDTGGDVWLIPAQGGVARRVTRSADYFTEPLFSKDGRTLYALHASKADRHDRAMEVTPDRATDLVALSPDTGERRLIAHVRGGIALGLGDDGRLRFTSPAGIESIAPDGSDRRIELKVEAPNPNRYFKGMTAPEEARLSPDGRQVLVKAGSQLWLADMPPVRGDTPPVIRVGVADTPARRLTQVGADAIAWAPDGRRLLWSVGATVRTMAHDAATPMPERDAARFDATVRVPRAVPPGRMLLRGATVLTMRGTEVIENADLLIDRDRIAAVGPRGSFPVPAGTRIRDIAGRFVTPGLVDAHAHWFEMRRGLQEAGHWDFRANLAMGVTAGLDVQPFTTDVFGYQDMIDAGIMDGPRAWSTGPGLFLNQAPATDADADAILSRYRDHYRTRNLKSYLVGGRAVRQRVVAAARRMGMMPTTEGASDHVLGLTHALDGFAGNEHNLPLTPLHDDVIRLIVASGMSYVPTLSVLYGGAPALPNMLIEGDPLDDPHIRATYPAAMIAAKRRDRRWTPPQDMRVADFAADAIRLQRAGGLVGMGSHGEVQGIGMHLEMKAYTLGGASPTRHCTRRPWDPRARSAMPMMSAASNPESSPTC
ncbi:amidohydrolase [Sphingomonas hankookensis]|uniref:amidohydrolase n=1 Tax=Sphingomonas hankookensis TaxID=563996 RepID=UPI003F7A0E3A